MTTAEKIELTKAYIPEEVTDVVVSAYLTKAQYAILQRRYPFGFDADTEVETRYEGLQCELAARYYLKRGAEGEVEHNENGINRSYGSANDEDLLKEITPIAKVGVS